MIDNSETIRLFDCFGSVNTGNVSYNNNCIKPNKNYITDVSSLKLKINLNSNSFSNECTIDKPNYDETSQSLQIHKTFKQMLFQNHICFLILLFLLNQKDLVFQFSKSDIFSNT